MKQTQRRLGMQVLAAAVLLSGAVLVVLADVWTAPARDAAKPNPVPVSKESVAAGRVLYTANCMPCHGPKGKGDGPAAIALTTPPGDLSSSKMWDQTDGALFWKITEGKKPMPTFETLLTKTQRWQVINYVRTLAPAPTTQKSE